MKFICYHNMLIAIRKLQFVKHFSSLQMSFCIFSKNCKSQKSYTSRIFRVIHLTSYIISYFKAIKYPLLNNNMISQKFRVHIISSFILAYFLIFFSISSTFTHLKIKTTITRQTYFCVPEISSNKNLFKEATKISKITCL